MSEWLPVFAEAVGAKPPRRVPVWLARLVGGREVPTFALELRGASNEKAKRELGWSPAHPSWRTGCAEALA
jgi:2-alkyl-3-oxoalkanoate reductase